METKGRLKVNSLQGSANTCMQWAVGGPPGDERTQRGQDRDGEREELMGQMEALHSLAKYSKRPTVFHSFLWIQS